VKEEGRRKKEEGRRKKEEGRMLIPSDLRVRCALRTLQTLECLNFDAD
jgi:hypothetical protein